MDLIMAGMAGLIYAFGAYLVYMLFLRSRWGSL
jgi:hypothetical protein